jgi:hypothetical protein
MTSFRSGGRGEAVQAPVNAVADTVERAAGVADETLAPIPGRG